MKVFKLNLTEMFIISLSVMSIGSTALAIPAPQEPGYEVDIFAVGVEGPTGLAFDNQGNLYVTNEGVPELSTYPGTTVSKVTPDGVVTTFASGFEGCSGLAFDSIEGNLYVSDDTNRVFKVTSDGDIEEFVTLPEGQPGNPNAIGFDADWDLYVVAHGGAIYRVTPEGEIDVFVDSDDIPGGFLGRQAIVFDEERNLCTSDESGRVFKITPDKDVTVFATIPGGTQGGIAFDDDGNLYTSSCELAVYKISPDGEVNPFVTGFDPIYYNFPRGLIFDNEDSLYIAECGTGIVWKMTVTSIAAAVDIDPDTLNLKSKGTWITCYIELPDGYDVTDIDVGSILLEGLLEVQRNDVQDGVLMVKFDRRDLIIYLESVIGVIPPVDVPINVTGELKDGRQFEGSDTIRVID